MIPWSKRCRGKVRGRARVPSVEGLESRRLLAVALSEYAIPQPRGFPYPPVSNGIAAGPDGNLWFTDVNEVDSINPTTHAIAEYALPSTNNQGGVIVTGPDGNLWFGEGFPVFSVQGQTFVAQIGMIDPTTHTVLEFALPASNNSNSQELISGISAGPDGNVWFTEGSRSKIGVINTTTHVITEIATPTHQSVPYGITAGPDGNLWFTEQRGVIGMIDPTTHAITEFPLGNFSDQYDNIFGITTGPDGKLWFTGRGPQIDVGTPGSPDLVPSGLIGVIDPTTHAITTFATPAVGGWPDQITLGSDGNLWFTDSITSQIGAINPATHEITELTTPTRINASSLTTGPDGDLWFAGGPIGQAHILPYTAISGTAYHDLNANGSLDVAERLDTNHNGTFDVNDPALPGRTVYLDLNDNGRLDPGDPSAITDRAGHYSLSVAGPGTYHVRMVTFAVEVATGSTGGEFSVTVAPGHITPFTNPGLLTIKSVTPLTLDAAPFGAMNPDLATAEVTGLYRIVLGRAPEAQGLGHWVSALNQGMPLSQVASDFLHSTEYESDVVESYYRDYLGRTGSAAEIDSWLTSIRGGMSLEQVAGKILGSNEFNHMHVNAYSFVETLYEDILGREGLNTEPFGWLDSIDAGWSRDDVIQYFLNSTEADTRTIDVSYATILGRKSDQSGGAMALAGLQGGTLTSVDLATILASSAEFTTRANATVVGH
jgi:virginiamycin B lyase